MIRWMAWAIAALLKPRALLVAENLCLRQHLVVLQRRQPGPRLLGADRRFWILARQWFSGWWDTNGVFAPYSLRRSACFSDTGWHSRHAAGNRADNFVGDGPESRRQLVDGDLFSSLAPDDDDFVAKLDTAA